MKPNVSRRIRGLLKQAAGYRSLHCRRSRRRGGGGEGEGGFLPLPGGFAVKFHQILLIQEEIT